MLRETARLAMLMATVVFIVDLSGFVQSVKAGLSRWLGAKVGSMKPFDCSLCLTWWGGLALLIIDGKFSIEGVAVLSAVSLMTIPTAFLIQTVLDWLKKVIGWLDEKAMK